MVTPAHSLIIEGRVKITAYGNSRVFWKCGAEGKEISIIERKDRAGTFYDCTCKNCTIYGPAAGICTFKAAVIAHKVLGIRQEKVEDKEK